MKKTLLVCLSDFFRANQIYLLTALFTLTLPDVKAQISMTGGSTTYSENFDGLVGNSPGSNVDWFDNSTIPGWYTNQTSYRSWNTGDAASNRIWSCGTATTDLDRALGSRMSSTTVRAWGVQFTNNTGSTLNDLTIGFDAESYTTVGTGNNFIVQYSTSSTTVGAAINDAAWTELASISGSTTTGLSYPLSSLGLADGSTIMIRFISAYSGGSSNFTLWATDNFTASWGTSTGIIKGNKTQSNVQLYPNPFSDNISIQSNTSVAALEFYNSKGQLVKTSPALFINTSDMEADLYTVKIIMKDGTFDSVKMLKH